ncbi:MAG: MBL fold metallo-hydrolase [Alcanivoracaceae bacterium]|nr:MBL fold metallo-hydrolase [Alcanivoracaceae bacterium]
MKIKVKSFYHHNTYTWSHLAICEETKAAVLIDPVLDYVAHNATTSTAFTDIILDYIKSHKITLKYIMETHAHADHLTSAAYIQDKSKARIVIGAEITGIQETFKKIFNLSDDFKTNGSQFTRLLINNDVLTFGNCQLQAIHTPGHTGDSMSYIIDDIIFIGDTLFSPEYGSARCDFPGGSAGELYDSVHKIYSLGSENKLYLCHDYPPTGRQPQAWFYAHEQMQNNIHLQLAVSKNAFIQLRNNRDKQLSQPQLIIPSIQVNIAAGRLPKPENNGISYLKVPINTIGSK